MPIGVPDALPCLFGYVLAVQLGRFGQSPRRLLRQIEMAATPVQLAAFQREMEGASIPRIEGVFATIVSTLNSLPTRTRELISPLGYVSEEPISEALLGSLTGLEDEDLEEVVEDCRRRSVVSAEIGRVVVHALTIATITATNPEGMSATALDRVSGRLAGICQSDPVTLRAEITHHERILSGPRRTPGIEHPEVLKFAGRYEEAVSLHEETLNTRARVLGPEHPNTLQSCNDLALDYHALGRHEEAVKLHQETLSIQERVLGPEHPATLESRNNLAEGCQTLEHNAEAVALHEENLVLRQRVLGTEHPDTFKSRRNLAMAYRAANRDKEADQLERRG